jgi:hypothetical protein
MSGSTKALVFGCLGLLLCAVVVVVTAAMWAGKKVKAITDNPEQFLAELVVKDHPEVELVKVDKVAKEVVFRDRKSGETATFTFDQVAQGKMSVKRSDGSTLELGPEGWKTRDKDGHETVLGAEGSR